MILVWCWVLLSGAAHDFFSIPIIDMQAGKKELDKQNCNQQQHDHKC